MVDNIENKGLGNTEAIVLKLWCSDLSKFLKRPFATRIRYGNIPVAFLGARCVMPSRRKVEEPPMTDQLKICVDVSGAVSGENINEIMEKIACLFKNGYKRSKAQLICWSDTVDDVRVFTGKKDIIDLPLKDGGTRDISQLFDYLSGKTKVNGFKQKTQAKDIGYILIVTDGKLDIPEEMQWMYYSFKKKVRWLVVGDNAEKLVDKVKPGKAFRYTVEQ